MYTKFQVSHCIVIGFNLNDINELNNLLLSTNYIKTILKLLMNEKCSLFRNEERN